MKFFGVSIAVLLVLNLVLMALRAYSQLVFWIIIIIIGGGSLLILKILNK